jgi:hypothetical protein
MPKVENKPPYREQSVSQYNARLRTKAFLPAQRINISRVVSYGCMNITVPAV